MKSLIFTNSLQIYCPTTVSTSDAACGATRKAAKPLSICGHVCTYFDTSQFYRTLLFALHKIDTPERFQSLVIRTCARFFVFCGNEWYRSSQFSITSRIGSLTRTHFRSAERIKPLLSIFINLSYQSSPSMLSYRHFHGRFLLKRSCRWNRTWFSSNFEIWMLNYSWIYNFSCHYTIRLTFSRYHDVQLEESQ